ncbi:hypothetical protein GALL_372920 [mine drainage metagenome]|uniref:Uncharacterized protein n=1 Tax=mine drainage metagenome TaxID=410659 RepID=A0A1J5QLZ7_9ZZZZ
MHRLTRSLSTFAALMIAPAALHAYEKPPAFEDPHHVPCGCYLSTVAFLHRFLRAYPAEHGQPINLTLLNDGGAWKPHTIAAFTWHHSWWGRDEYFGVFPTQCSDKVPLTAPELATCLKRSYERKTHRHPSIGAMLRQQARRTITAEDRIRDVRIAAGLCPYPSQVWWVDSQGQQVPFLYFRPGHDEIALYDPCHGTATAFTPCEVTSLIVAEASRRMGYMVQAVRPEAPPAQAFVSAIAASTAPHASGLHP